jgi:hypothetical protein
MADDRTYRICVILGDLVPIALTAVVILMG